MRLSCLTSTPAQKQRPSSSSSNKIHLLSGGRCRKALTAEGTQAFLPPAPCHDRTRTSSTPAPAGINPQARWHAKAHPGRAVAGQLPSAPSQKPHSRGLKDPNPFVSEESRWRLYSVFNVGFGPSVPKTTRDTLNQRPAPSLPTASHPGGDRVNPKARREPQPAYNFPSNPGFYRPLAPTHRISHMDEEAQPGAAQPRGPLRRKGVR